MELWIRSQDKEKLLKVNDIAIEMNMIYGYYDKNTEYELLGQYKSKERALEVLDEIQRKIESYKTEFNDSGITLKEVSTVVYEMPKN